MLDTHSYTTIIILSLLLSLSKCQVITRFEEKIDFILTSFNSTLLSSDKLLQRDFVALSDFFLERWKHVFTSQLFKNISVILFLCCLFVFKEGSTKSVFIIFHPEILKS